MVDHKFCVSWQPGTFGNLLLSTISIQKFNAVVDIDHEQKTAESHKDRFENCICIHPHDDSNIPQNVPAIKPYFEQKELTFFPKYLHYLKWFKEFPTRETFKNYYNIKGRDKSFYEEILKIYWNHTDPPSSKCFNIKMDNFFYRFDHFISELESFMGEKLKNQTLDFLQIKRDNNLPLLKDFTKNVIDSTNCLVQHNSKNIHSLSDYEKLLIICTYVQGDWSLTKNFIKYYSNKDIVDVMDVYSIINGKH